MRLRILVLESLLLVIFFRAKEETVTVNDSSENKEFLSPSNVVRTPADCVLLNIKNDGINSIIINDELPCRNAELGFDLDRIFELTPVLGDVILPEDQIPVNI